MRILLADSNHPVLVETLKAAGFECDLFWDKKTDELIRLLPLYDGLVIRSRFRLDKTLLDTCTNMKVIGRVGAGMENIEVAYAESKGIRCVCVPEGNRDAVGEHAMGMLLMLLNHLKKADAEVRHGIWLRAENRGTELAGKTVGIIGYGNMGSAFAKKLSGFDCKVLAYDKYKKGFSTREVKECRMEVLFEEADILSIHLPLTEETTYFVNAEFLRQFKKPIYIINTARGKCVNTADLVNALESKKVLGACLDVLEYESTSFEALSEKEMPLPMRYLIDSERVVVSPHIAGWTHESNFKMSKLIAEKMVRVLT
ncbi:MAG: NAD(P)-dependent oxidoreductase [bacterium]|nr:NAD(P)-dependent oxidoreductase [bacterium]